MRIYVGTYAKYNNGSLKGAWLDLSDYDDHEEFMDACLELHKDEDDPELMFQDWEDIPEGFISESHLDKRVFDLCQYSEEEVSKLMDFVEACLGWHYIGNLSIEELMADMEDRLVCHNDDWREVAEEQFEEMYEIPDHLLAYIDWGLVRRDFETDNIFGEEWVWRQ